jgi:hypothetical protein
MTVLAKLAVALLFLALAPLALAAAAFLPLVDLEPLRRPA